MKETGIVRKVDDLGRIVIPKEIRKTLKINEGNAIEIYVDRDEIILKKYSPVKNLGEQTDVISKCLSKICGCGVLVFDQEKIISAQGEAKEHKGARASKDAVKIIKEKKSFAIAESDNIPPIRLFDGDVGSFKTQVIIPIVSKSDEGVGLIALVSKNSVVKADSEDIKLAKLCAELIASESE